MRHLMLVLILIAGLTFTFSTPLYAAPPAQGGTEEGSDTANEGDGGED